MTALDTNILIDLLVASMPEHENAWEGLENLHDRLCTTPTNLFETFRLLTHPRVFPHPLSLKKAHELVARFLESQGIDVLDEPSELWMGLGETASDLPGLHGNDVFDARIALTLKSNGVKRILTRDQEFRRFSYLHPVNWRPRG
ncbi:MAG: PIN domain-containing protein [Bdellovibrionaceae bacterium]|nr:PIN domain-containing protein [Pseudobdellovibrionaceae bacterium]